MVFLAGLDHFTKRNRRAGFKQRGMKQADRHERECGWWELPPAYVSFARALQGGNGGFW